jgi:DNA (cytosine-5)-methyltransferase 1
MKESYLVLDLFSGAGGFARGFEEAGFKIAFGIDNYPPAAKSFKANYPKALVLSEDIKEISGKLILDLLGLKKNEVDVIIASPPCEPFTGANPKRMKDPLDRLYSDPEGQLYLHAIRIIGEIRPKYFVIENVPGILEHPIRSAIRRELRRVGYKDVYFNVLHAEKHGTPSRRTRVFVSNTKLRPKVSKGPKVIDVLKDLPPPGAPGILNHDPPPELSPRYKRRLPRLRWGDSLIEYKGADGRRRPNYIRLNPYDYAPTVMGTSRFIHPFEDRLLTVREQARLMGFPDHHIFLGGRDAQYDQVGEAVPPPLAKAIAEEIYNLLRRDT